MKNTLRVTFVLLMLTFAGSANLGHVGNFDGPGPPGPGCLPDGTCPHGASLI